MSWVLSAGSGSSEGEHVWRWRPDIDLHRPAQPHVVVPDVLHPGELWPGQFAGPWPRHRDDQYRRPRCWPAQCAEAGLHHHPLWSGEADGLWYYQVPILAAGHGGQAGHWPHDRLAAVLSPPRGPAVPGGHVLLPFSDDGPVVKTKSHHGSRNVDVDDGADVHPVRLCPQIRTTSSRTTGRDPSTGPPRLLPRQRRREPRHLRVHLPGPASSSAAGGCPPSDLPSCGHTGPAEHVDRMGPGLASKLHPPSSAVLLHLVPFLLLPGSLAQSLVTGTSLKCLLSLQTVTSNIFQAMFPHLQHRQPSDTNMSHEDRRLFCLAASDFYAGLTDDKQKTKFIQTFEAVSSVGSPYSELLNTVEQRRAMELWT